MRAYDQIADDWEARRVQPVDWLFLLLAHVPKRGRRSAVVLDAGCGNARNLVPLARAFGRVVGLDSSAAMLAFARRRALAERLSNAEFVRGRVEKLPFPDASFHHVFSLAVLHHLRTPAQRAAAFRETARVLKPGGLALVSVWNRNQPKFQGVGRDAFFPWTRRDGTVVRRFYHFYDEQELRSLAKKEGLRVRRLFYARGGRVVQRVGAANLCLVLEKPLKRAGTN